MGLDRLIRLVPPPATPVDAGSDWQAVTRRLGVRLPGDYRGLVEQYGWGEFCDLLRLWTPFGTNRFNGIDWQTAPAPPVSARDRERYPYPLHPAPGGLLVWGGTIDADRLCWLTGGEPQDWPVVVWSEDGRYETFAPGAAEFIEGWIGGRITSRVLAEMEPELAPWFTAARPRVHRCLHLTEGALPHAERLRVLRAALAPTADRGSWRSESGDDGQDHFATADTDWLLTYDLARPHQIRIAYPAEHSAPAWQRLHEAVELMGCRIVRVTAGNGLPVPTWDPEPGEALP